MIIDIRKVGSTDRGNFAVFNAVFESGLTINGIARYKDFDLKEGQYKDLYLYMRSYKGKFYFSLYKK